MQALRIPEPAEIPEHMRVAFSRFSQVGARRNTPFTKERKRAFLDAVSMGLSVTAASELVGVDRRTVYYAAKRDENFRDELEFARDLATDVIEERLQEIVMTGAKDSMATVRAGEVLLKGLSSRYRNRDGRQKIEVASGPRGMAVRIGIPGPD